MKIVYKLTDSKMRTCNGFQWELGKWYETTGEGELCSPSWLHFYSDSLVGLFMNPIHAGIENPRLFRAEVEGKFLDNNGLKCGYSRARLIEELTVPQISPVQRVRFAILCTKEVYKEKEWNEWADNWLSGKDRTEKSATITFYAAKSAKSAFYATSIAFYAAKSAVSAAESAAKITAIAAEIAAESAVSAAKSATIMARSAEESAIYAAKSAFYATKNKKIDLVGIVQKAMKE